MIIKRIFISAFGGIKDLSINLSSGMNIIYGKNEAGKSSTQAFIKAMFYGFTSNKQSIRDNDRKRYIPWDSDSMNGELIIEDEKKTEYLIKRSFARTKKNDTSVVLNSISGAQAKNIDELEPGINIFGLGCEAFEKTLFIKQLESKVSRDNEDEIMTKLSNLSQSGDEEISFHKSKEALEQALKSITNNRKSGKIDIEKHKLYNLTQEKSEGLKSNDEIIYDQIELNKYIKEFNMIKTEIDVLDITKQTVNRDKLYKEFMELRDYMKIVSKASEEIAKLEQVLNVDGKIIDQQYIYDLKEKYGKYLNYKVRFIEIEGQVKGIADSMQYLVSQKDANKGFESLDPDIEQKLSNYRNEIMRAENLVADIDDMREELKQSETKLANEKMNLGDLISFEGTSEKTEQIIITKEEKIRNLNIEFQTNLNQDNRELRYEILKDKRMSALIIIIISTILSFAAFILGLTITFPFFAILFISIPFLIYEIFSMSDINKRIKKASEEIAKLKNIEEIKQELKKLKDELEKIYSGYNVSSYREYDLKLKRYYESKTGLGVINALIQDNKRKIFLIQQSINLEDIDNKRDFINNTFLTCNCIGMEDFTSKIKTNRKLEMDISRLNDSAQSAYTLMEETKNKLYITKEDILKSLKSLNSEQSTIDKANENIKLLAESRANLNELQNTVKSTNIIINSLMLGRSVEEMEKQIGSYVPNDKQEGILSIENIDNMVKDKNTKLNDIVKIINNFENSIKTKLIGKRSLDQIDAEIEYTNDKITYYENTLKSIELAITYLEDSFEEIRKNFGPKLNRTVGEVLSKITLGKYRNVKIADNYDVKIEDKGLNLIKEIDYFSNGTFDQIYFALRLGIIDLIYGKENTMPIILDDTFVQYDDERLKAVLEYLHLISKNKQIILFTCQNRDMAILKEYTDIKVMTL